MKLSEVIKEFTEALDLHGDLPVRVFEGVRLYHVNLTLAIHRGSVEEVWIRRGAEAEVVRAEL